MKQERIGYIVVSLLLLGASLFLFSSAKAQQPTLQTLPTIFNPNPEYWRELYTAEQIRADGLAREAKKAITGLQSSLQAANDTIRKQNLAIVNLVKERNGQADRAEKAEAALEPVQTELDKTKGKTWAGKALRKIRDGAAVVGGVVLVGIGLKIFVL